MEDLVKSVMDKVSEYELFNSLIPGIIFSWCFRLITNNNFLTESIVINFTIFYFVGVVIGRIGSIIIEPILTKEIFGRRIVKRVDYKDYLKAEKDDPKIAILNSKNNVYRSIIATMVSLIIVFIANKILSINGISNMEEQGTIILVIIFCLFLFILSYKKQTETYIRGRVEYQIERKQ